MLTQLAQATYTTTYPTYDYTTTGSAGMGVGSWLFFMVIMLVSYIPLMFVFKKAGQAWWKAIVPIYNIYVLLKLVQRPGWWLLLFFVPFVNFVILIVVMNDLSKAFGHGVGFTLGLIFFSFIFMLILAFDSSKYVYAKGVTAEVKPEVKPADQSQAVSSETPSEKVSEPAK
jgi:hypothetical protein